MEEGVAALSNRLDLASNAPQGPTHITQYVRIVHNVPALEEGSDPASFGGLNDPQPAMESGVCWA